MSEVNDQADEALLKAGWGRVAALLAALLAYAAIRTGLELARNRPVSGLPVLAPWLRRSTLHLVQQAEALVRRLLGVMALRLPPSPQTAAAHGAAPRLQALSRSPVPASSRRDAVREADEERRTPAFRLFETIPPLDCHEEPAPPPVPRGPLKRNDDGLFRRIRALQGVLKHRARAARRLARHLARRYPRLHNLRGMMAPGVRGTEDVFGLVHDLTEAVRKTAWARAGPDHFKPKDIAGSHAPRRKRGPTLVHVALKQGLVWR